MFESAPNGYFLNDLIVFHGLRKGCYVSKGFLIEPPELSAAAPEHLNVFQDQIALVLACLHNKLRLQVQWFCDSDYRAELLRYNEETDRATNVWTRRTRNERFTRYWLAMEERRLRRQRLVLFLSREIDSAPPAVATRSGLRMHYEVVLQQLGSEFEQLREMLGQISGQNETLSWPFLQLRDEYSKAVSEAALYNDESVLEDFVRLRLEMVDYNLNLAVLCAVFLTKSKADASAFDEFAEITRIRDVESLRLVVRRNHQAARKIKGVALTEQHRRYIENFKKCATCWDFEEKDEIWTFDFLVTDETRRALGLYFTSTWALFAAFQRLEMLNYLMVDKNIRVAHAKERKRRTLSAPAPQPAEPEKVFMFQDVCLRLTSTPEPVDYIKLSDGEHQFGATESRPPETATRERR